MRTPPSRHDERVSPRNYFSAEALDRAGHRRRDPDWLADRLGRPQTRLLVMRSGQIALDPERRLALLAAADHTIDPAAEGVVFLGVDDEDEAVFAVDLDGDGVADLVAALPEEHTFVDLRGAAAFLPPADGHWAAYTSAMLTWHRRHRWCGACGTPTVPDWAGHIRRCPGCGAEHFPRTDPVTIMLPVHGDHALLGRQATWPKGRFSCLAGFMEPGESIEAACAREVMEEAGLTVVKVSYHSSQPWPFPSNLMIGLIAEVSDRNARPDQTELEEVRWFGRGELKALLAGELEGLGAPPPFAIAHQLMKAWIGD